ncbi:hypothetical protein niasHT_011272 [Heterodera trifolii]|uniref:RNA helicase n=1 Tax=Heterodera trifolii TaxID=157864 RepID=A0ABD2L697_9BILA
MTLCDRQKGDGGDGFQLLADSLLTYNENNEKLKKKKPRTTQKTNDEFENKKGQKEAENGRNGGGHDERQEEEEEEEIQRLRRVHRIFTWGHNIPRPISDFASLPLPDKFRANLRDFIQPTPVQMQGIPIGLLHRDHLITAPTGSGKTLSFAIPLIVRVLSARKERSPANGQQKCADIHSLCAVVIEPTKILAKQTYENFVKFCDGLDINCEYLRENGIGEKCDILVTTPNRFIFALEKLSDDGQKTAKLVEKLQWLILDECDRMFDRTEGEASFRVQLSKILRLCNGKETRRGFYSATFSYEVEEWCKEHLEEVVMACIGPRNSANELVKQELLFVGWEQAKVSAVRDIVRRGFDPPALLFLQSKDRAKQLFVELAESCNSIPIGLISGELTEEECEVTIGRFRSGKIWLLICTEMMGRGIDFQEVNMVINFDLPTSIVSYIHRIGRTGRAGRIGRAVTLFTESDLPIIRPIATVIQQAGFSVPEYLLRLNKPSKKDRKKLKRVAPKRKNLLPNWGKLKHKILIDTKESKIKIGKRKERRKKEGRESSEKGKRGGRKAGREKADTNRLSLASTENTAKRGTIRRKNERKRDGQQKESKRE